MKRTLRQILLREAAAVRDICFSGNGGPTLLPWFPEALEAAVRLRDELVPQADLVAITSGTGLFDRGIFSFLREAAAPPSGFEALAQTRRGNRGVVPENKNHRGEVFG
ncbi:MAG: hypothetical protein LBG08_03920 [Spirochaetaceae bacterium]|nr:hypothetical protein [Spirochaetaceae bacterium]